MEQNRDVYMESRIRALLGAACPGLHCFGEIDSTNTRLKRMALEGAEHGSVVMARSQNAGRGRMGRTFLSPEGKGLYLSLLLRPNLPAEKLMRCTGMAAVAACRALERACGVRPAIKWTNDLVLNGRKLCGILAETVISGTETALVIGVGINLTNTEEDFGAELRRVATSLALEGHAVDTACLAAALIRELKVLADALGGDVTPWVEEYRSRCVNLGKEAQLLWTEGRERVVALDVDDSFGLIVQRGDGTLYTVCSGEVSVRGMYSYIDA